MFCRLLVNVNPDGVMVEQGAGVEAPNEDAELHVRVMEEEELHDLRIVVRDVDPDAQFRVAGEVLRDFLQNEGAAPAAPPAPPPLPPAAQNQGETPLPPSSPQQPR